MSEATQRCSVCKEPVVGMYCGRCGRNAFTPAPPAKRECPHESIRRPEYPGDSSTGYCPDCDRQIIQAVYLTPDPKPAEAAMSEEFDDARMDSDTLHAVVAALRTELEEARQSEQALRGVLQLIADDEGATFTEIRAHAAAALRGVKR